MPSWNKILHVITVIVVGVACLVAGGIIGSWSACGTSCNFDVALFEAIGTWVGGTGAIIAAFFAAWLTYYIHRRDAHQKRIDFDRTDAVEAATALNEARQCVVRASPGRTKKTGPYDRAFLTFTNPLDKPVTRVALLYEGIEIARDNLVAPQRAWGDFILFSSLGTPAFDEEKHAREFINSRIRPNIVLEYDVSGRSFIRKGRTVTPVASCDVPLAA